MTFSVCMKTVNEFLCFLTGLNFWEFVYELSGCGIDSRCRYLSFRYHTWYSGKYRKYIHSKLRMWLDKKTQLKHFFPLYIVILNYFICSRLKASYTLHAGTTLVLPGKNQINVIFIHLIRKTFPIFQVAYSVVKEIVLT